MPEKLTDTLVKNLPEPGTGNLITYDTEVKGFGCRVTAGGARSFVINYRTRGGRERRYTIGAYPVWSATAARDKAKELKRRIRDGIDPLADVESDRGAKTIADLCERYRADHLPKKRPSSQRDDNAIIDRVILPEWRHHKAADITHSDVEDLHAKITRRGRKTRANRVVAVASKMFSLAVRWRWRPDNPVKGLERNPEPKRHRYLSAVEIASLSTVLAEHHDQHVANMIRLLLLTGARTGELVKAEWRDFELDAGVWTKPAATVKTKGLHRVPLSAPARQLLVGMRAAAPPDAVRVLPLRKSGKPINLSKLWPLIAIAAGMYDAKPGTDAKGRPTETKIHNARVHDLRHTFASVLASAGLSLPIIGGLLGHSTPTTTARYAHLLDDPLRQATERAGAIVTGGTSAAVVTLPAKRGRR